jgi:DNA polymerase III delta prime subunit
MQFITQTQNFSKCSISQIKSFLKDREFTHSLPLKNDYLVRLERIKNTIVFPWRKEQQDVINEFCKFTRNIYVVHAVFGSGKTTLLIGLLMRGILEDLFKPSEVMFVSFNLSIRNEIKRKLKELGISSKVTVRTFDSIIYEICKNTGYKYNDLPNYEGKRKYVYEKLDEETLFKFEFQPKIIFIDECQDLEKQTMNVFKKYFPKSKFVLAGDIFQSIQKEPRESVLWEYMNTQESEQLYKIYMSETPRVPKNTLNTLKKALTTYYPEFKEKINNWSSSNTISNADIEWRTLDSYSSIFDELSDFCNTHKAEETMILTFSSAITVKGAMGDVARLRRYLSQSDIQVNKNHKKMIPEDYFLTTANSSKGLERDYVIAFLTFPLENAFINLSDDIVVNLITVALTRAKKKVIMYVPTYTDKFSRVLHLFDACPKPTQKIRQDAKTLSDFEAKDFIEMEHTVTELIRQQIIKYDTRIKLREQTKIFNTEKLFDNYIPHNIILNTEEEKAFIGVVIENLITSTWINSFPFISDYHLDTNPLYNHCLGKINSLKKKYEKLNKKDVHNINDQIEGILCFAQIQIAMSNKIVFNLSETNKNALKKYWTLLKPKILEMSPKKTEEQKVKIQCNLKMKCLKGVADVLINDKEEITIYEIKASSDYEWKDDALTQAMCYALMCGKKWSRIVLLNPFRNEKVSYYFNTKNIMTLREYVYQDVLTFNMNCMLAKNNNARNKEILEVENNLLTIVDNPDDPTQIVMIKFISPIKIEIVTNLYASIEKEKAEEKKEKYMLESKLSKEEMLEQVRKILEKNKKNQIFSYQDVDKLKIKKTNDVEESINEHTKSTVDLSLLDKSMYFILELFRTHRFI